MKKYFILTAVFALLTSMLFAQTETGELPYSFGTKGISQSVDVQLMPATNVEKLLNEDASVQEKSRPLRMGIGYKVDKTFDNSGRKDITEDGGMLWRAKFVLQ